jgi:hypothetical protein
MAEINETSAIKMQKTSSESGKGDEDIKKAMIIPKDHSSKKTSEQRQEFTPEAMNTLDETTMKEAITPMMTENELNQLAAKILRAELIGDIETKNRLENQLNIEKVARASAMDSGVSSEHHHVRCDLIMCRFCYYLILLSIDLNGMLFYRRTKQRPLLSHKWMHLVGYKI